MASPVGEEAPVSVGLEAEESESSGVIGNSKAENEKTGEVEERKEKRISFEHC